MSRTNARGFLRLFVAAVLCLPRIGMAQGLIPRAAPAKPVRTVLRDMDDATRVILKFREGSRIRFRRRSFVSPDSDARSVELTLRAYGVGGRAIERVFERPERELDAERERGQARSRRSLADLNLYYRLTLPAGADAAALCDELNALPVVELAVPAPLPAPPPADIPPVTPDFSGAQGYRGPAPSGIDLPAPALVPGSDGSGTTIVDVEYNWVLDHEDIGLSPAAIIDPATLFDPFPADQGNHGTAVLGELAAQSNGYGVTGIAPGSVVRLAPAMTVEHSYDVARAVSLATAVLGPGDVILLEQQGCVCDSPCADGQSGLGPVEYHPPVFDAIATAVASGITVVEAAGNGSVDLDGAQCAGAFDRRVQDSGAIIVGAGDPLDRSPLWFSCFGSRVDLQGWGLSVMSTGYGYLFDPGDIRQRYTGWFSGTSSASPIVAGAALAVQGARRAAGLAPLSPFDLRQLLVSTGTPPSAPAAGKIGPLPNVTNAIVTTLPGDGVNLIANPGFELGRADWNGWGSDETVVTDEQFAGTRALRYFDSGSSTRSIDQDVAVVGGTVYMIAAAVRATSIDAGQNAHMLAEWRTAGGAVLRQDAVNAVSDQEWRALSAIVAAPSGAASLRLHLRLEPSISNDGAVWFDDIVLRARGAASQTSTTTTSSTTSSTVPLSTTTTTSTTIPGGTNLITNQGFELGQTGWSGWGNDETVVTDEPFAGARALRFFDSGSSIRSIDQIVPVVGGTAYTIAAAMRATSIDAGQDAHVLAEWRTSAGAVLRQDVVNTVGTQDWRVEATVVTAPAGAASLRLYLRLRPSDSNDGAAWFDDVVVSAGASSISTTTTSTPSTTTTTSSTIPGGANLVANPGFELGQTGWSGWGNDETVVADEHVAGTRGLRFFDSGSATRSVDQTVQVVGGTAYTIAAALHATSIDAGQDAHMLAEWRTAAGAVIRQDVVNTVETQDWRVESTVVTAPAGAASLRLYLRLRPSGSNDGAAWFDEVRVSAGE